MQKACLGTGLFRCERSSAFHRNYFGRLRLFEVIQKVKEVNAYRRKKTANKCFVGESYDANELKEHPALAVSYIVAPPRMAKYMEISARIYNVYLKYIAPEDIHVYSIDEVFIDATAYLKTYSCTACLVSMPNFSLTMRGDGSLV